MNQEIKKKWVEALRSGEYKQEVGYLRKDNKFCCLGVLCDIYEKETGKDAFNQNHQEVLPYNVSEWAGLGIVYSPCIKQKNNHTLSYLNDIGNCDFQEISNWIDEEL